MRVVALVGNKGGAGKTTLCVNLATALNARAPTVILDADPQRSSLQWRDLADRDDAVEVADAVDDVDAAVGDARARFDFIVIDCPPSVHAPQTARVLALCDVALVPGLVNAHSHAFQRVLRGRTESLDPARPAEDETRVDREEGFPELHAAHRLVGCPPRRRGPDRRAAVAAAVPIGIVCSPVVETPDSTSRTARAMPVIGTSDSSALSSMSGSVAMPAGSRPAIIAGAERN